MYFSSVFAPPASSLCLTLRVRTKGFLKSSFFLQNFSSPMISEYVKSSITTFFSTWLWIQMNRVELSNPHSTHRFSTRCSSSFSPPFILFFFIWNPPCLLEEWRPVTVWRYDRCKREFCVAATSPKIILLDLNGTRITRTFLVHYSCSSNECFRIRNLSCSVSKLFKQ